MYHDSGFWHVEFHLASGIRVGLVTGGSFTWMNNDTNLKRMLRDPIFVPIFPSSRILGA